MKASPNKYFFAIIIINTFIFVLTFLGMVLIPFIMEENLTESQISMFGSIETVFKMSAGAFIGLLGGRASKNE